MNNEEEQIKILKAIAHPVRLKIVKILQKGALCAGRTNNILSISQPNFSQHLKVLREAGLIERVCKGTRHCYYLAMPELISTILTTLERPETIIRTTGDVFDEVNDRCTEEEILQEQI
jgi:ArsR family transcriptional regulator